MKKLSFPEGEYLRRWTEVQAGMTDQGLDALVVVDLASICYLSGFQTIGSYGYGLYALLLPAEGVPVLFASDFEGHNASIVSPLEDVVTYPVQADPVGRLVDLLRARNMDTGQIACEQGHYAMTPAQFHSFNAALPRACFADVGGIIDRVKIIKSDEEIAVMRRAAQLTTTATAAAIAAAREGVLDNDVAAAAYEAAIRQGAEYFSIQPIVTVGPRSGIPHTTFRRVPLRKGDCAFIEISAAYERYSAPNLRTVSIGPPSDDVRRAYDGANASVTSLLENLRDGASSRDVASRAGRALGACAPDLLWHGYYAYSVGLTFPPMCCDCMTMGDVTEATDFPLRAGMTLHCSTSLRKVGAFGVTLGDTVLITRQGCERLTAAPPVLSVN